VSNDVPVSAAAASTPGQRRGLLAVLTRGAPSAWPPSARVLTISLILIGAVTVAASAIIHLHLWIIGYRHIHLIGPLFLAQSVAGMVLAVALITYRRLGVIAAGVAYMAGSIGALIISATVGFLGLHDGLDVPWATTSLTTEVIGFVSLAVAGAAILRAT
jgi:hypothetical protein